MAKGSGLSFDPDHTPPLFHDNPTVIINSFQDNHRSHPKFYGYNNNPHGRKLKFEPVLLSSSSSSSSLSSAVAASAASSSSLIIPSSMEIESSVNNRSSSPPTIPFPVNLNSIGTTITTTDEDQNKPAIGEMDFFARNNDTCCKATSTIDADASDIKDRTVPTELNFNVNTGLHLLTGISSSDQSMVDDGISPQSDEKKVKNELAILQSELERMNSENRRLKETLNQVTNNYNNLHMHLMTLIQQQQQRDNNNNNNNNNQRAEDSGVELENDQTGKNNIVEGHRRHGGGGGEIVPRQFMDLRLAPSTATETADETSLSSSEGRTSVGGRDRSQSPTGTNIEGSTAAGAGNSCVREDDSPEKSSHWVPNKVSRVNQAPKNVDQATEATMRKARVSVRARSDAPMISDGCQWRKYGQKMAKGNPCPRAYYRCTMAAGCPVRKQVQRCAEDKEILITTYEGNHNHPLPPAAMAMASTTSSAARMLLSGSMPSADGIMNSNFLARTLLPCSSSMATISASAPFPTVTLDLTQNPNPLQFQRNPIINNNSQFHVPFPNSSQNLISNPASGLLPHIFGQALYNQSKFSGLQMSHDSHEAAVAAAAANQLLGHQGQQNPLADTVTALTADPNFTAALAAAITSLIGNSHPNTVANKIHNNVTTTTTSTSTTTTNNNNNNGSVTTISNNNSNGNTTKF